MSAETIPLGNDWEIERDLTERAAGTGTYGVATGLTGGKGRIAATPDGPAIHTSLEVDLTERGGKPGTYVGIVQGADLTTHLAAYVGRTVYDCTQFGSDYRDAKPVRVVRTQ